MMTITPRKNSFYCLYFLPEIQTAVLLLCLLSVVSSTAKLHIKQDCLKFFCQVCDVRIQAVCMAVSSGAQIFVSFYRIGVTKLFTLEYLKQIIDLKKDYTAQRNTFFVRVLS